MMAVDLGRFMSYSKNFTQSYLILFVFGKYLLMTYLGKHTTLNLDLGERFPVEVAF